MRLALVQLEPELLRVEANLAAALAAMQPLEADLYLLPELFPSGYTFTAAAEVERAAEPADAGPSYAAMAAFARERGAHVAYGFAERGGDRKLYNSANLVGPTGLIGTYRKIHLFGRETLFFQPGGEAAPVWELPFGRVGMMVCFDWYFPEMTRSLALRGAELVLQPANLVLPHCPQAMITRSLENRVFTATCDRVGREVNGAVEHRFIGQSQAVSPRGEVLVRLSGERAETAVVEMDLAAARSKRVGDYNDLFGQRREELYPSVGV
ncbi:MAG TPA: nitrilase-related carbon-nitrogen hydrolase [Terriglobales bacterium]|nr:nitrilase-related carbon-nitrogen hydrolase [Terriglobales bacterium]